MQALCLALAELGFPAEAMKTCIQAATLYPEETATYWDPLRRRISTKQCGMMEANFLPKTHVVVASLFCGADFQRKMKPARDNHARWCSLQGYTYACFEENIAGREDPTWSKILIVQQLLKDGAEYVFWMDADSLFIHDGVSLDWACKLDRDFVFAGDLNVVFNAGHFLVRAGQWADQFLTDAFSIYPWKDWEDNGAMMILLGGGSASDKTSWRQAFEKMR
eukprot:3786165-Amphidinium_carterae.1